MQYVLDRGRPPVSLITAGSPASSKRWNEICQSWLDEMPAAERAEIERLEAADMMLSPEYEEAMQPFYRRHVCRLDPWPDYVVRSFGRMALPIYHYMAGPSEFRIIGTLRDWDIMGRLGEIRVPALITCGEFDECRPVHTREVAEGIPGSRLEVIPDASHLSSPSGPTCGCRSRTSSWPPPKPGSDPERKRHAFVTAAVRGLTPLGWGAASGRG